MQVIKFAFSTPPRCLFWVEFGVSKNEHSDYWDKCLVSLIHGSFNISVS